jgi:hypothetical protein
MQNQEIQQSKKKTAGLNWKKEYVIFVVLPIIFTILFPLGALFYSCGRFSPSARSVAYLCMLYPVICVFIVYCFFAGITRLSRDWRKHGRKTLIIAEIGIPLVYIALFVASFFMSVEGMAFFGKPLMYGLRERVRSKADIKTIRNWLKTLSKEDYVDYGERLSSEEWPKSLKVLNPNRPHVSTDENGNPKVRLMWGGGFLGHWGLEIGMENMKIPPSDFSQYGEYRLPVEPGVYVWSQLQ